MQLLRKVGADHGDLVHSTARYLKDFFRSDKTKNNFCLLMLTNSS